MGIPYKRIICIDYETAWDSNEYTLSKMTTEEYIRDPRFKAWGMCWHEVGEAGGAVWVRGPNLQQWTDSIDWSETAVLAHNAMFDVAILCWRYGAKPCFIFDSLSMARALRGVEVGNSLAKLAVAYQLPPKGTAVVSTNGMLDSIDIATELQLAEYCKHDVYLCEQIFSKMLVGYDPQTDKMQGMYPVKELELIDMTLKMFVFPVLELDKEILADVIQKEEIKRNGLLKKLGVDEEVLASNIKFGNLLENLGTQVPWKKSKITGAQTRALAKNDALFQALLNGDNEDVALLCEARLAVKSTGDRTRAQRFLDIANRGPLPVPLSYYAANTGRWGGTQKINLQNLKRKSGLRNAMLAPEGYQLVVGDLSQIEPRVLAWLSGYEELLDIFRSGQDPYAQFGAQMFGVPGLNKNEHPLLRQSAKSALLGCVGGETKVLTRRGWVPIVGVQATDMVWDGQEWVTHRGVLAQGEKGTVEALGLSATSDHEILTEHGWVEWNALLDDASLLMSALSSVNLPAQAGLRTTKAGIQSCGAPVVGRGVGIDTTYLQDAARDAEPARVKRPSTHGTQRWGITLFVPTLNTATDCLTASARLLFVAPTHQAQPTPTTVGVASRYTPRGLKIVWSSCATLLAWLGGTHLRYNLIVSTTTAGTSPATYGSAHAAPTCPTNAKSPREKLKLCVKRMQTYDIAFAGPRNRYTVLTDVGPLIVHNCGYGLGWANFAGQLLTGFLGAPPVRYEAEFAKQLGVTGRHLQYFINDMYQRMAEIPHTCTEDELLVHCAAAKAIIDKYRMAAQPVVAFWEMCNALIERSLYAGDEYNHKGVLLFRKGEIVLPNDMSIKYPDLRRTKEGWVYGEDATKIYGGKITNNCIAEGTLVLTAQGWTPIEQVIKTTRVHDGVEFVHIGGILNKGVQSCVNISDVWMTPDHEVLTDGGWKAASQNPQPRRFAVGGFVRSEPGKNAERQGALALFVRLRKAVCEVWGRHHQRSKAWGDTKLWVHDAYPHREGQYDARHDAASGVRGVAQHGEPLHKADRPSVQELWLARHNSMRALAARISAFLGRHGRYVRAWFGFGTQGQRRWLQPYELFVGNTPRQQHEQAQYCAAGGRAAVERTDGYRAHYAIQPHQVGVASGRIDTPTVIQKQVWDIVNCGPRERFVVLGADGPFVVHNCTQGIARCVMTDGMLRVRRRYFVAGTVHDEQIAVVPDDEVESAKTWVLAQMVMEPEYLPGIPLAAEVGAHRRYGEAKQ
jgi:hypothetical protein